MFRGVIPSEVQSLVAEVVGAWPESPVLIGCSGNLTIERVLKPLGRRLGGNDVTLYSCSLGCAAANQALSVAVAEPYRERFGWLDEYLGDPVSTAATVVLASRFAKGAHRADHPYWKSQIDAYRDQWGRLHEGTAGKLRENLPRLESFDCGGILERLQRRAPDEAVVCYPPFYTGDYEAMFRALERLFVWPAPEYRPLDEAGKAELVERATRAPNWMIGLHYRAPELADHLIGIAQTTNRGVPIYVYGTASRRCVVRPRQKTEALLVPHLGPGDELQGPLKIVELTMPQFAVLRSEYMNAHIRPGTPRAAFGVLAGGYLVGAFAVLPLNAQSVGAVRSKLGNGLYLLSDFPVSGTRYKRLAKLVLYAALSREAANVYEQIACARVQGVLTTAFSDNPVSMKYRGLFKLVSRTELPEQKRIENNGRFQLNYWAQVGKWSLAEGFEQWQSKHGQTESPPALCGSTRGR